MSDPLEVDADLPICTLCGTQYPVEYREDKRTCPICEDERQWTKSTGQEWTSLRQLQASGHKWELLPDKEDKRLSFIKTTPPVGIGQSPMLIETSSGSYVWDCAAFIDRALVEHLKHLDQPLKAIVISHPHFYTTSLTWSRALDVPLVLAAADREWYMRRNEVKDEIEWFEDVKDLSPGVKVIRCGGHFPGSSVLIWDRNTEPKTPNDELPRASIAFVADTLFVQPTQKGFTFAYSVPNLIPLSPAAIVHLLRMIWQHTPVDDGSPFEQATSSWPDRWIREDASRVATRSAVKQLQAMGWDVQTPLWTFEKRDIDANQAIFARTAFRSALLAYEEEFARAGKLPKRKISD